MKIFIVTTMKPGMSERLYKIFACGNKKMMKSLRQVYPFMKKEESDYVYATDSARREFLHIYEREISRVGKRVYVVTHAEMFQPAYFYNVFASFKETEERLKTLYPDMVKDSGDQKYSSYKTDPAGRSFIFIRETEVEA